jgi:YD repeat-containing protein
MKNKPVINYPLVTKDSKGNEIHIKDSDGYEYWNEYDENSNRIHYKDSDGSESWYEYDENNNLIHYKNSDGFEFWKEYDENNNLIHRKDSFGSEAWFDSKGNRISNPNLVTEVTLKDIAEKFGVDVKSLKIKK